MSEGLENTEDPRVLGRLSNLLSDANAKLARKTDEAALAQECAALAKSWKGREASWPEQKRQLVDKLALEYGKRMVLWDDEGSGFYLWINWDWETNKPRKLRDHNRQSVNRREAGWYENYKHLIGPPLLDPTIEDAHLATWIDANTMRVHRFLNTLDKQGDTKESTEDNKIMIHDA
ncbi:hypothetical protein CYMTET_14829 [Cymbomonas tetramitiformis]|uniref:Uncharacterized protein n=1 Tax=Cymbomonas tetramitiformis TaxID=36881 RepID=A0AAE0L9S5_9CHLO|nr:hypothetical protein CYMTET_14829 [Cymbomonas tetramitiformis]